MPRDRLRHPPSSLTGVVGEYFREIHKLLNNQPLMSYVSVVDPNASGITGRPGDILVNITSASTGTRMFTMTGGGTSSATTGWRPLRIA